MKTKYKVNSKAKFLLYPPPAVNQLITMVRSEPLNIFLKVSFKMIKIANTNSQFTNDSKYSYIL